MSQLKYKYKFNKILSIIILIITVGLMYLYYEDTYSISSNSDELGNAISDYIFTENLKAEVVLIQKENNWMYVLFTDKRYGNSFKGLARLKRGWNRKYTIYGADYGSGYPVSHYFFANGEEKFVIYGMFPDENAVRYEYINTGLTYKNLAEYSGAITNKAFIQVCNNGEPDWEGIHLYDSMGKNITKDYNDTRINNTPTASVATAELFMVNIICGFIFIVGFAISFLCWRTKKENNP